MSKYIGVDWASKGWFGVILRDEGEHDTDFFPSIWSLWKYHSDAARIFIDIPLGLPSNSRRACDVEAKQKLDTHQSRVFYTPTRDAVYKQNIEDAKAENKSAGFSIQNQAWGIVPRIREVDEFLDMYPGARDRVYETHPELCFYALNGQKPVAESKKSDHGIEQRKALLADEHPDTMAIYEECVDRYMSPEYASFLSSKDDILDALVAAVSAGRDAEKLTRLPEGSDIPRDERRLPMQMVYPSDTNQTRISTLQMTQE